MVLMGEGVMRRLLFTLALLTTAPAAAVDVPHYAEFRAWLVACDNLRRCEARGFDTTTQADLRLLRGAGDAAAELRLTVTGDADPAGLLLDGTPLQLSRAWSTVRQDGLTTIATHDPAAIEAFLRRAKDGHRLSFGAGAEEVPLDGLTAALGRIDDVQARGRASPPAAPAPPPHVQWRPPAALANLKARSLASAVRQAQAAALAEASCTHRADMADEAFALDAERALVILPCDLAAYQGSALVFVATRAGGRPERFAPRLPTIAEPMDTLVDPTFDSATGTLSTAAKGRGIGDCGLTAEWRWADRGFHLVSMARQEACGGAEPGDWPSLFRTAPGE